MRYKELKGMELPSFLEIEIVVEDDSKQVYVHSKSHTPKKSKMTWSYADDYPDHKILWDHKLVQSVCQRYGIREVTKFEVT